jgi:hypothetical protein
LKVVFAKPLRGLRRLGRSVLLAQKSLPLDDGTIIGSSMRAARYCGLALCLLLCGGSATAATITWSFAAPVSVLPVAATLPGWAPYLALDGTTIYGRFTFDSDAPDFNPLLNIGEYVTGPWSLEVPAFNTTWGAASGLLQVATTSPNFAGIPCFNGCLRGTALITENSNSSAPGPPPREFPLPAPLFEFRAFALGFLTDGLPVDLESFRTGGWQFSNLGIMGGPSFTVQSSPGVQPIPEPASLLLIATATVAGYRLIRAKHGSTSMRQAPPMRRNTNGISTGPN